MNFIEKAERIGADLVALAAQEGHDGEDWDKIQEAGWMLRELAHQIATSEAPRKIHELSLQKDFHARRQLYHMAFNAEQYMNFPCAVNAHALRESIAKARGQSC